MQDLGSAFRWCLIGFYTLGLGIPALAASLVDRSGRYMQFFGRIWSLGVLRLAGAQVEVHGRHHLRGEQAQVIVANHQGYFDIFALLTVLRMPNAWMLKQELLRIPIVGWCMARGGHVAVDRFDAARASRGLGEAEAKLRQGISVVVFPEGTRSRDGQVQPFKKGAFLLALRNQAPILPISLSGSQHILAKGSFRLTPGVVRVVIHPPWPVKGLGVEAVEDLIIKVRDQIVSGLGAEGPAVGG
ncbi:MAG: 1-acyl-sn-glycerol-3-phosphate acyltransferase [Deltaproteobacteria bacterium]|nr:1-acyl-sn-glycerol-3-phosphate acyltransferase [Deltaproteobacteria bacterium]